jgi:hypothetical protein
MLAIRQWNGEHQSAASRADFAPPVRSDRAGSVSDSSVMAAIRCQVSLTLRLR